MLTTNERLQIIAALRDWASHAPDEPLFGFVSASDLMTPYEIVGSVEEGSEDGEAVLAMIEHGVRREGLASVLERMLVPQRAVA